MTKRRTKMVCTIGPSVSSPEMLEKLVREGMDVARLNFSHGNHEDFRRIIQEIRELEKKFRKPIGILGDVQGPKIRVGKLKGGELLLKEGDTVWIITDNAEGGLIGNDTIIPTTYKDFSKDVGVGTTVLFDDGLLEVLVVEKVKERLKCEVIIGGILRNHKGINVPEVTFSVHAITEKDYADILFCVNAKVDFIALSFVRSAQEVRHLKSFLDSRNSSIQVISKIEMREAEACLEEIIDTSDGILVARGDLAVEIGSPRVPVLQKKIVRRCNLKGKPVIIATQMLMSMVDSPRPTRAEASDVANAIVDGADAIMLSNETAMGRYPLEAVQMMNRIVLEMEAEPRPQAILYNEWELSAAGQSEVALLQSAVRLASILKARAIVVVTRSGASSLLISKCRPDNPVYAVTGNLNVYRQFSLKWGVYGLWMEDLEELLSHTTVFDAIGHRLLAMSLVNSGDTVVITAGLPGLVQGSANAIKIHKI